MLDQFFSQSEQEMEFMPIVPLGEDEMNDEEKGNLPTAIPLIALRNTVLFPNVVLPITVAREKSIKGLPLTPEEVELMGKYPDPYPPSKKKVDVPDWCDKLAEVVEKYPIQFGIRRRVLQAK